MQFYNLKGMVILGTVALFLVFGTIPAQAIPIEVEFTAWNFQLDSNAPLGSVPSPVLEVTGTIIYEADSFTADIESLISIDLNIFGHNYLPSEIGFDSHFVESWHKIGGISGGLGGVGSGSDDFWLDWNKITLGGVRLEYSSERAIGRWVSHDFSFFSVEAPSPSPIPEPATMLLLGSGLIGLVGLRRKFRK